MITLLYKLHIHYYMYIKHTMYYTCKIIMYMNMYNVHTMSRIHVYVLAEYKHTYMYMYTHMYMYIIHNYTYSIQSCTLYITTCPCILYITTYTCTL